jgi:hypothetical protein
MKTYYFEIVWPSGHTWAGKTLFLSDMVTIKGPNGMVVYEHLYSDLETWAQSAGLLYKCSTKPTAALLQD